MSDKVAVFYDEVFFKNAAYRNVYVALRGQEGSELPWDASNVICRYSNGQEVSYTNASEVPGYYEDPADVTVIEVLIDGEAVRLKERFKSPRYAQPMYHDLVEVFGEGKVNVISLRETGEF